MLVAFLFFGLASAEELVGPDVCDGREACNAASSAGAEGSMQQRTAGSSWLQTTAKVQDARMQLDYVEAADDTPMKAAGGKENVRTSNSYGDDKCKCVAIEGLTGTVEVTIKTINRWDNKDNKKTVKEVYPAQIGSYCSAWDEDRYPHSCAQDYYYYYLAPVRFAAEKWCAEKWCYVDPCDCELDTDPSPSYYLDGATFEGKQVFYSYATCGSTNYLQDHTPAVTQNLQYTYDPPASAIKKECGKDWDDQFGLEECPCVGMNNISGTGFEVVINEKTISDVYPEDLGSKCSAWDEGLFPESCTGGMPEEWCSQKWCYVSKDNCIVPKGPFASYYLQKGKFQGEPLYYSYLTCDGHNTFNIADDSSSDSTGPVEVASSSDKEESSTSSETAAPGPASDVVSPPNEESSTSSETAAPGPASDVVSPPTEESSTSSETAAPGPYVRGGKNTNVCPEGYERITTRSECEAAAAALLTAFKKVVSKEKKPTGCYTLKSGVLNLNTADGSPDEVDGSEPVCKTVS